MARKQPEWNGRVVNLIIHALMVAAVLRTCSGWRL